MNKTLKIGGMFALGILSILGIMFILAMFGVLNIPRIEGKSPPAIMEPEQAIETEPTEQKPAEETPNSTVKSKWVVWDKTPAEQGLKVDDWITVEGYLERFIGASIDGRNGIVLGLKWNEKGGSVFLRPNPLIPLTSEDRIVLVWGWITNPSANEDIVRANELHHKMVRKSTPVSKSEVVKMRMTGEIFEITEPQDGDKHPNQWGLILKRDAKVEFIE